MEKVECNKLFWFQVSSWVKKWEDKDNNCYKHYQACMKVNKLLSYRYRKKEKKKERRKRFDTTEEISTGVLHTE